MLRLIKLLCYYQEKNWQKAVVFLEVIPKSRVDNVFFLINSIATNKKICNKRLQRRDQFILHKFELF